MNDKKTVSCDFHFVEGEKKEKDSLKELAVLMLELSPQLLSTMRFKSRYIVTENIQFRVNNLIIISMQFAFYRLPSVLNKQLKKINLQSGAFIRYKHNVEQNDAIKCKSWETMFQWQRLYHGKQ